jgi:hypothetical protein
MSAFLIRVLSVASPTAGGTAVALHAHVLRSAGPTWLLNAAATAPGGGSGASAEGTVVVGGAMVVAGGSTVPLCLCGELRSLCCGLGAPRSQSRSPWHAGQARCRHPAHVPALRNGGMQSEAGRVGGIESPCAWGATPLSASLSPPARAATGRGGRIMRLPKVARWWHGGGWPGGGTIAVLHGHVLRS